MVNIEIRFVNGGLLRHQANEDFICQLRLLEARGLKGRTLIHELLTDDWAAPPTTVHISGQTSTGEDIDTTIVYA